MPSFEIPSWKFGMDQRRARAAGAVSTLWDGANCHLTRGGDIQRSKAFVPIYTLPAGCFGLLAIGSRLFTFGSGALTAPPGMTYQQLVAENGANMIGVLAAVAFIGKTYVVAEFDDGNVRHFYDSARVTDWDSISDANASFASLADYLANKVNADPAVEATSYGNTVLLTAKVAGTATTVAASAVDHGGTNDQTATVTILQAAVAPVAETLAVGSFQVTGGTAQPGFNTVLQVYVGATPLMLAPVDWVTSNAITANAVAAQINNLSATSGYSATTTGDGTIVQISASPGTGASPNGLAVTATLAGDVYGAETAMAGGVTAVVAVGQIVSVALAGTFESTDYFSITVGPNTYAATGRASGAGTSAYVFTNRIYSCANTHLKYCAINNPADWTNALASSGAGFINIASQTNGSERLIGCVAYAAYTAIFSNRSVRLYNLTADATQVSFFQSLDHNGSIAPLSFQAFQTTDVFYLDTSGVRSLRERDTTYTAYASDVGSAVDTPLQAWIASVGPQVAFNAVSVIEPLDGRYMIAIGSRIWVYSYFPATQIGAWTHYDPGISISAWAVIKNRLYCLAGNVVYLYGGTTGQIYPAAGVAPVSFETPFHSPGDPESEKIWTTVEVAATGVWKITLLTDPDNWAAAIDGGTVVNNTYRGASANTAGRSQLFALKMTCSSAGYADFSSFLVNYLQKAAK